MPETVSFGTWLRQQRRALDLTQKAFAEQVGCAEITVRRMEADEYKPSNELALVLFEKLGIPESDRPQWVRFARGLVEYPKHPTTPSPTREPKTNLPIPLTSFIGREKEVERIQQRLAAHRLVTLIGVGGIGKTRLSQQVANQLIDNYANGVWLVELAALNDPKLVPQSVATVLGIQQGANYNALLETLIHFLRAKTILLILDNCEHLLDACAGLADKLLKSCPHLKILATSREALGIIGEALYPVPSLTIPDIQQILLIEKLNDYESIRLFNERAQLVQMDFALTKESASSVVQICHRLDGIPLAIELAAVRVQMFSAEQIAEQLDECFHILTGGSRTALPKHQTLQASIDWSWHLLHDAEQILLRRLSVFAGGFTLGAAEQVCAGEGIESRQVLGLITQLEAKSLVVENQTTGRERRYRLLETIRQYAREKLIEAGEEETIRTQHLKYFLQFSEQAEFPLRGPTQIEWYRRLNDERDNIRAALQWADQTDAEAGLYLSSRLHRSWESIDFREGNYWIPKFLQRPESHAYPRARAKALVAHIWILDSLEQFDAAHSAAQECLKLFRTVEDRQGEVDGLLWLAWESSNPTEKLALIQQALALAQSLGDVPRQADALGQLGWLDQSNKFVHWEKAIGLTRQLGDWLRLANRLSTMAFFLILDGDINSAQKHLDEANALYQRLNPKQARTKLLSAYGQIALIQGDFETARAYYQENARICDEFGNRLEYLWSRVHLGYIALCEGSLTEARDIFVETVQDFQKDKNIIGVVFALEGMAGLDIAVGKPGGAARLIGWSDAAREKISDKRPLLEQADVDKIIAACQAKMGETAFSDAYEEGQKISMDEAVALALDEK